MVRRRPGLEPRNAKFDTPAGGEPPRRIGYSTHRVTFARLYAAQSRQFRLFKHRSAANDAVSGHMVEKPSLNGRMAASELLITTRDAFGGVLTSASLADWRP
jgi:hypothetical protein